MPFGPYSLWAERERRSTCHSLTSIGRNGAAWTASTWNATRRARQTELISEIGCIVPTSLLAAITLTSTVRSVMADSTASGSTKPCSSTARYVTSKPWRSSRAHSWRTALCSMALVMMCRPRADAAQATPLMARLSDSVPPLVNTISRGLAPSSIATVSRASSSPWRARRPERWMLEGLPQCSEK